MHGEHPPVGDFGDYRMPVTGPGQLDGDRPHLGLVGQKNAPAQSGRQELGSQTDSQHRDFRLHRFAGQCHLLDQEGIFFCFIGTHYPAHYHQGSDLLQPRERLSLGAVDLLPPHSATVQALGQSAHRSAGMLDDHHFPHAWAVYLWSNHRKGTCRHLQCQIHLEW